ncbi:MAG: polysaccharide biosynthesis protein [Clostridia bacterium]
MKKRISLVKGAMVLAVTGLISKIIGALYRIPLNNFLTAEGMGMYQLIFSIYALLLALSSSGIPVAISRLVAERRAEGHSCKNVLKSASFIVIAFSLLISVLLIVFGDKIANFQGNSKVEFGYAIIAPAIVFVGGISIFRGWFQGNYNIFPTAISQMVEQIVKLTLGLFLVYYLLPRGIIYSVYGALLGVTISEVLTLFYMMICYFFNRKKYDTKVPDIDFKTTSRELVKITLPIAIGGLIIPISQFIDSIMIVNLLKLNGLATSVATAEYGLFSGTVMSIVNMPIIITLSLAIVLVPIVSAGRVDRDLEGIIEKSATAIKLSYVIGLPSALLMFVYARPILVFLYPMLTSQNIETAVALLRLLSFTVIFQSQMQIYNSLLQALDRTYAPVKNMLCGVFVKTVLAIILLKTIGINGAAVATLALGITSTILNVFTFNKLVGKNVKLVKNVSTILVSSVIMTLIALIMYYTLGGGIISLLVGGLTSAVVYALSLMLFKVFEKGELDGVPFIKYFERLSKKIRFWEN